MPYCAENKEKSYLPSAYLKAKNEKQVGHAGKRSNLAELQQKKDKHKISPGYKTTKHKTTTRNLGD